MQEIFEIGTNAEFASRNLDIVTGGYNVKQCISLRKLTNLGTIVVLSKCSGCGVKLFTDFHFVKHLQTCKKMDEAEKQKMDEVEKQKMDEAEKQKMDEAEKQKMDEAEKQKMDEAEKQKMDEAEKQKMDEAEKQKMDKAEKQKIDKAEHMNVKKHICSACGAKCFTDFIFMVHLKKCMEWKLAEASSTKNKEVEFLKKIRRCGGCGAQLFTETTYKKHLENCKKMHSKPIIHACSGCGKEYSNDSLFVMHLKKCMKWIMAEASSTRNKEVEFLKKMHKAEHEKIKRKCGGCGALFFTSFTFNMHLEKCKFMQSTYKKPIIVHSCSGCGVECSNDLSFMKHLEKCKIWIIAEDSSIKKEEMEFLSKMHKAEYNKKLRKCSGCGQEYFSNMTFAQHLQICNIWMMAEASSIKNTEEQFLKKMEGALKRKSVASEKVSKTVKHHSDQVLEIDKHHTDKMLTTKTNKRGSNRVQATEADKLSCSVCGQEFLYDWLYAIHLIRCSKWTEAEDSDAKFEENDFLKKIYKRENAVQMLYKCRGCGLECASYQTLVTHFLTCKEWKVFDISEDERIALDSVMNAYGTSTASGKVSVCQEKADPNYRCRCCSKKFKIIDYWRACESSHKATSKVEVVCHQCSGCGREFITDSTFVRHLYYCEKWKMAEPSSTKDEEQFILELYTTEDGSGTIFVDESSLEDKMSDDESDEISPNGGINKIFDDVVISDSDDEDLGQIPCTTGDQSIDFTDLTRKNYPDSWIPMRRKFRKEMIMVTKHPKEESVSDQPIHIGEIVDLNDIVIMDQEQNDEGVDGVSEKLEKEQNNTQRCDENSQVSGNINPEQSDEGGGESSYGMIELVSQNDTAGIEVVMYPEQIDTDNRIADKMEGGGFFDQIEFM
ncbi:uncharacterized protein [Amphiura filiformis]|uniref:uncharacterized protein n=1 Tax=Amphiura filiformis TaxID=82378 RepID=UPI003B2147E0